MLGPRTRFVSMTHVANSLGTVNPVREIIEAAHAEGAPVMLDAAQSVPHLAIDVQGARMRLPRLLRPQSARADRHRRAPRQDGAPGRDGAVAGGRRHDPRRHVREDHLERGALPVRGGHPEHRRHDRDGGRARLPPGARARPGGGLRARPARVCPPSGLGAIPGSGSSATRPTSRASSPSPSRACMPTTSARSSTAKASRVRTGHHCTMPVMARFEVPAMARASLAFYNTRADIDALAGGGREGARGIPPESLSR